MKTIITIPAYNEEKTIGKVVNEIKRDIPKKYYDKIIVVNDGSKDNTAKEAKKAGAYVISHPYNRGLASAFRTEIDTCLKLKSNIIVHIDADGQYVAKDILKLLKTLKKNKADLVLGSRFAGHIESMPIIKRIGNRIFSDVISRITYKKITDSQTGLRVFTSRLAKQLPIRYGFTYTQEQILEAAKAGFKIIEVPITFRKRKNSHSKLMKNPLHYALRAGISLIRTYRDYEPLRFFGGIGAALVSLGLLIGITFIMTPFNANSAFQIFTLIIIMSGVQITLFGFLADKHNVR